ncbi:hypothetical protein AYO08_04975 [Pseudomonas putida]|uniref:hypothetical protein n=1 Tax=Pseudomonas putida TaxID=303 RepID=UPI0007E26585|nr:hypothetical protein [Pseudomonas putida]OAS18626.1 hypothetical protein AYO08_04975 [Pseudomonas putida]
MPTENRSSNTEMVSVPRELLNRVLEPITSEGYINAKHELVGLMLAPSPQPHPEPIAWMVGTAFWWTKEEAERDAAATGLPIVGLGPMTSAAPAEQHHGDAIGTLVRDYNERIVFTPIGDPHIIDDMKVYAHADPGEVERLRAALKFYADRDHFAEDIGSDWDSVSGEPANVLWHEQEAWFVEDGSIARAALERQP